jgi:predicted phage replisome organizer
MADSKKYYWLKLKENFFDETYIKALRKLPDGDKLAIVYLKLQLKNLKNEGILKYKHIMPNHVSEIALDLDEDENIVKLSVSALINMKVIEVWDDETLYLSALQPLIGSESESAERVRKHRDNKKALQCNIDVTDVKRIETKCNTEIEKREKRKEKREKIKNASVDFLAAIQNYTNDEDLRIAILDFVEFRKELKKPFPTLKALELFLKELKKYNDKTAVIEQSIMNSWSSIYPLKQSKQQQKQNQEQQTNNPFYEIGKDKGLW